MRLFVGFSVQYFQSQLLSDVWSSSENPQKYYRLPLPPAIMRMSHAEFDICRTYPDPYCLLKERCMFTNPSAVAVFVYDITAARRKLTGLLFHPQVPFMLSLRRSTSTGTPCLNIAQLVSMEVRNGTGNGSLCGNHLNRCSRNILHSRAWCAKH